MFYSGMCQTIGKEVLLGPDNFRDLLDGPQGVELHYRCHCGHDGVVYPRRAHVGFCRPSPISAAARAVS